MYILITYDVDTVSEMGQKRLRQVARICKDYGQRVQNSVFECEVTEAQYAKLKDALTTVIDKSLDSIRCYHLNKNKNHQSVLRALPMLPNDVHYVIAGEGGERDGLLHLARELGVDNRLHMLGFRKDVPQLLAATDVYVLPSKREGLNVSLIEAMASGLPCVCRDLRGNVDLIDAGEGGVLVEKDAPDA